MQSETTFTMVRLVRPWWVSLEIGGNVMMRGKRKFIVAPLLVAIIGGGVAAAALRSHQEGISDNVTMSMVIKGISGEGTGRGSADINVDSFSWGASRATTALGGTSEGKASFAPLTVTKQIDVASPKLYSSLAADKALSQVFLYVDPVCESPSSGSQPSTQGDVCGDSEEIILTNVHVSNVAVSGSNDNPYETISFVYEKVEIEYFEDGGAPVIFTATL
jgi:type VI secretion system Hcp family effector